MVIYGSAYLVVHEQLFYVYCDPYNNIIILESYDKTFC